MSTYNVDTQILKTILETINKIEDYAAGSKDAEDFYHNAQSFDATMLNFIMISDLITKLDDETKERYEVDWDRISQFEHKVTNNYFGIDSEYLWYVINYPLLEYKQQLEGIIESRE